VLSKKGSDPFFIRSRFVLRILCGVFLSGSGLTVFAQTTVPVFQKIAIIGQNDMQSEKGKYRQVVLVKTADGAQGAGMVFGARCDRVITAGHLLFDACGVPKREPVRVTPRPQAMPDWSIPAQRIYGDYGQALQSSGVRCKALPQISGRIREQLHLQEPTILALRQPAMKPGTCTALTFSFQLTTGERETIQKRMQNHGLGPAQVFGFKRSFFGNSKRVSATGNLYFKQAGDWTYYRSPLLFQYDIDTLPGFSGGPVVIRFDNKNVALGINIVERYLGQDSDEDTDYQAFTRANIGLLFSPELSAILHSGIEKSAQRDQNKKDQPWQAPQESAPQAFFGSRR